MIPYYALLLLPLIYTIYSKRGKVTINNANKTRKTYITVGIFFSIFIIMLMLRGKTCGVDLPHYEYYFNGDANSSFRDILSRNNLEIGFHIFNKLVSCISTNFQLYIAIVAIICVVPLWILYAKNSDLPYLSIAVFVTVAPFSLYFSGLRQALAICVVPLAYHFTKNKKLIPFILSVLLASVFHQSAFIIVLMYPVFWAKFTRRWIGFVVPVIVVILVFNTRIYEILTPFMGERYFERYGTVTSTGAYAIVVLMLLFTIYASLIPDNYRLDEETSGLRNLLFLSTCLQCFAPVNTIAMRMNYYFLILVPITISKIPVRAKAKYYQTAYLSYVVMCLFFVIYFFYNAHTGADILQIYPYVPFWSN